MPNFSHYSKYGNISEAIVDFGNHAREQGLNVGVEETLEILKAAQYGILENLSTFKYALKSIYCCSEEDQEVFEKLFDWFWEREKLLVKSKTTYKNQSNLHRKTEGSLVMMGKGKQEESSENARNVSGANAIQRLRKTDFSKIEEMESQYLEELALKLWKQMSLRLKRKMKASNRKSQLNIRQTIRANISRGGELIRLHYKDRKKRKKRLVILLDVSGSMDKYSFFLLRFLVALKEHFEKIEAFIFSTNLVRITDYLNARNLSSTLSLLSSKANNWSGGTKIGASLKTFNEEFAKKVLNGYSTVIVLSDGLDTGSPEDLAKELKKIKLRTRQLIWLNPLKGMKGYQPVQKGMSAALPQVDVFRSAHNLDSILELENLLLSV